MKNLKISAKLTVVFALIGILLGVTVMVAFSSLSTVTGHFDTFYSGPYTNQKLVMQLQTDIQSAGKYLNYAFAVTDQALTDQYVEAFESDIQDLIDGINTVSQTYQGDRSHIDNAISALNDGEIYKNQIIELASNNENIEAAALYFDYYLPYLLVVDENLQGIYNTAQTNADMFHDNATAAQRQANIILIATGVVSIVLEIISAVYITMSLNKPITELRKASEAMAVGDFDSIIEYHSKDELGILADSFRKMNTMVKGLISDIIRGLDEIARSNLNIKPNAEYVGIFANIEHSMKSIIAQLSETMRQINIASGEVNSGSVQVSNAAQALSQGATEQASSVEELAAAITEISEQIKVNAEHAKNADEQASDVGNEMQISNERMQELMRAMEDITNSSNEIGKIIKTIDDIAFQTNILALNAAVEAARAGNAGKGFAVVADEVRNLASKSAEAAKDTTSLIESSINAVKEGTQIANNTAQSLVVAVDKANEVTKTVAKIAQATSQQAQSISQVSAEVEQISNVVQTNSATAEESAAASEQLTGQAILLDDLVAQFKLLDENICKAIINAE